MALAAVVLSLAAAAVVLVGPVRQEIAEFVGEFGRWAPAGFVALYVVLSLALVPTSVLTVTGGILFGAALGGGLSVVGAVISALVGFALGRRLGRRPVARLAGDRLRQVDRWLGRHGFLAVAVARNLPALPYGMLNYAAGVTGISARRFVAGTVLGIVPGTLVYAGFGASIDDIASPQFALAVAGLVVLLVAGAVLERRLNGNGTATGSPRPGAHDAEPATPDAGPATHTPHHRCGVNAPERSWSPAPWHRAGDPPTTVVESMLQNGRGRRRLDTGRLAALLHAPGGVDEERA